MSQLPIIGPNGLPLLTPEGVPKTGTVNDCCCDCVVVADFTYEIDDTTTGTGTGSCEFDTIYVTFTDASSTPVGTITWRRWNFGDGSPVSYETNPIHGYDLPGVYRVTLEVSNGECVSKKITNITVPQCCPAIPIDGDVCGYSIMDGTYCMWALLQLNLAESEPGDACDLIEQFVYLDDPGARVPLNPGIFEPPTHLNNFWAPDSLREDGLANIQLTHYCTQSNPHKIHLGILLWTVSAVGGINNYQYWICGGTVIDEPDEIFSGYSVTFSAFGACICPINSATVTFLGVPCGADIDCSNGPLVTFELNQYIGCSYAIDLAITPGSCADSIDDMVCVWSDGIVGCDRVFANLCRECGETSGSLTVRVWDPRGCMGEYTVEYDCCCCENLQGELCGPQTCFCDEEGDVPATVLTITEIDEELCLFELAANGNCGLISVCGLGVGILYGDCLCGDGDNDFDFLCGGCLEVPAGETRQVTIAGCKTLRWTPMESHCGCNGPTTTEEICCEQCECCEGPIGGAIMSVSGIGTPGACDCSDLNIEGFDQPHEGNCSGSATAPVEVFLPPDCGNAHIEPFWALTCDENGYYLTIGYRATHDNPAVFDILDSWEIDLGDEKPICEEISECWTFNGPAELACDFSNVTVCAEFY